MFLAPATMSIANALKQIRAYTRQHSELSNAEYFIFDRHILNSGGTPEVLVLGINPKESQGFVPGHRLCQETSSEYDFRAGLPPPPATKKWLRAVHDILGDANITTSEFFFWASANAKKAFRDRFNYPFTDNPHLGFCKEMNKVLIREYAIAKIVCSGLQSADTSRAIYGLEHKNTVRCPSTRDRLIEHFSDGRSDWIFTKHWTGGHGFSLDQKQLIKAYIRAG